MRSVEFAVCAGGLGQPKQSACDLSRQGVRAIETGPPDFILSTDAARLREIADTFAGEGVRIRSTHAPFGNDCNLSSPDPAARTKAVEVHWRFIEKSAALGTYCIVVHPGTDEAPGRVPEMREWIIESLAQLAPAAESTGVRLALENMLPKHPGTTGEELIATLDAVGSDSIGICFDSGHAHVNGALRGVFEAVKDRIITFHIHDNDGVRDNHYQPPYGTTNWEHFLRIFRTMDFDDAVTIEAAPWGRADYARMIDEVGRLFTHFEEQIAGSQASS